MTRVKLLAVASAVTMILALSLAAAPIPPPFHNISGYEFATGNPCIWTTSDTCGVSFLGWIGSKGPVPNGWRAFPGNTQGLWEATLDYSGTPGFGNTVTVLADGKGVFDLLFKHRPGIVAMVTAGTVMWPNDSSTDSGCGPGVATVNLTLSNDPGGPTSFQGCLHDLPALSVLPPKIWGTLQ